jgi:hypothetical protein
MKRVEFLIRGENGGALGEPQFVENCSELPLALMRAVDDYLEAQGGKMELPIVIRIFPSQDGPTC